MPQNPIATINVNDGTLNKLWISVPTVVKAQPGMIGTVDVQVAGAAGSINDAATTAAANTSNQVAVIPATVGPVVLRFPCLTGITVVPGAGQVVSVSYR
jgi:hypothetical protein